MSAFMAKIRLATKLLAAITLVAAIAVLIGWRSIDTTSRLHGLEMQMVDANARSTDAGRATANLLSYARAVEFLPIELPAAERTAMEALAVDEFNRLERRLISIADRRISADRPDVDATRTALSRHREVAQQIQLMSREGNFDAAGRHAFEAAGLIATARQHLRAIEDRSTQDIGTAQRAMEASFGETRLVAWVLLLVALPIGIIASALLVLWGVVRPLSRVTAVVMDLARGDLETDVPGRDRADEIGSLAQAVEVLRQNSLRGRAAEADSQSMRDASEAERRAATLALAEEVERSLGAVASTLATAATQLDGSAATVGEAADHTREMSASAGTGAQQATASVQTVAAAAEELTASVAEISRQIVASADATNDAAAQARATDQTVSALADGARRIEEVARIIGDIAGQTNLLALNATIEAARAGDAGKGFAVVAGEVKALASQTAKATEEVSRQIAEMQTVTRAAVDAIQGIVGAIATASHIAGAIAAAVEEQGAATQEIARAAGEAAQGTQTVSGGISRVADSAADAARAIGEVRGASGDVARQGEALREAVRDLSTRLRRQAS